MKRLLKWVFPVILSIVPAMGMDHDDSADQMQYQPRVISSRSNFFKTAMVGLGLMLSETPAFAQSTSDGSDPITGFGGCYLVKGNLQILPDADHGVLYELLAVSQIITSGCPSETIEPFYPHGEIKDIDTLYIESTSGIPSVIFRTVFCGLNFDVKYDRIMDSGFNMSGYNTFNFPVPCSDCFLIDISKSDQTRGRENLAFDKVFSKFMNTGDCFDTPIPTPSPTRPTSKPTQYPSRVPTPKPTYFPTRNSVVPTVYPTYKPSNKPTSAVTSSSSTLELSSLGMLMLSLAAMPD